MLDPKRLRSELDAVIAGLSRRGFTFDREHFEMLEAQRKALQVTTQNLQNERNSTSKSIGKAKAAGEDIQPLLDAVANLGDELKAVQEKLAGVQQKLQQMLLGMPNIPEEFRPKLRLVGKAITATAEEIAANVRARSARLRVAERT